MGTKTNLPSKTVVERLRSNDNEESACAALDGADEIERLAQKTASDEAALGAIAVWLEQNQPDVFKRGLWDAIREARKGPFQIDRLAPETRAGACAGKWHIPMITCSECGTLLKQCPECRVIAGHRNNCSSLKANEQQNVKGTDV